MSFLDDALSTAVTKKIRVQAQYYNRVSQAGIECARRLQWHRTRWRDAAPVDEGLQRRFELGHILEPAITRMLEDGGVAVLQRQRDLSWPALQLTGHVDGVVQENGEEIVLEAKSCSSFVFQKLKKRVRTAADLLALGGYLAGYVAQVGTYVLLMGFRRGIILFANKEDFRSHSVEVSLDDPAVLETCEAFLKRIEAVNRAIKDGVDLAPEEGPHCERCPFVAVCLPDTEFAAPEIMDDEEVVGWLEERESLQEAVQRREELDEALKARFDRPGEFLLGSWNVRVKESLRTTYDVPPEVKDTFKKQVPMMRRTYGRFAEQATVVATSPPVEVQTQPTEPAPPGASGIEDR